MGAFTSAAGVLTAAAGAPAFALMGVGVGRGEKKEAEGVMVGPGQLGLEVRGGLAC